MEPESESVTNEREALVETLLLSDGYLPEHLPALRANGVAWGQAERRADAVLAAGFRHADPPEVSDRERLARIIWRVQYSDLRGYPTGGQSFAHAMADAALAQGFRRVDAGVRAFIDAGRRLEDGKAVTEYAARTATGSVWYPAPNGGLPGTSADEVREHLGHRLNAGDDIVRRTRIGRDDIVTEWEVVTDE